MAAGRRRLSPTTESKAADAPDPLSTYGGKRNFEVTPEPAGKRRRERRKKGALSFVIQKHWASHLHYDFRLEAGGVLLSWAVPKGPCYDPKAKRMAVHVEDHPLDYASFEGTIPAKQYGAGDVIVWDRGTWEPVGDTAEGMTSGKLVFRLHGEKLAGLWELVRISKPDSRQDQWILFKKRDDPPLLSVDTADALLSAAQMNAVEFHTWNSTARRLDRPDRVIFDLDPGEGVKWKYVQEAALLVQTLLGELDLKAWLKTSGGKGLHVVVPLAPRLGYDAVKEFSQTFVRHLAKTIPERFSATSGPANRIGKVYVDYLRNGIGQTTAAAFSARARPGMGVSMPVAWDQLFELKNGAQWGVQSAREYLSFQSLDPWSEYWTSLQSLTVASKRLK